VRLTGEMAGLQHLQFDAWATAFFMPIVLGDHIAK
jgi:hypothetical protein